MAVTLRFYRLGKKNNPFYRIVAIDKRKKRNGSYIESIGTYDPMVEPSKLDIKKDRLDYWKEKGATISASLGRVLKSDSKAKKD
jgi:small subunit ribosomal protein S16